jgi:WD40 repeat protein
MPIVGILEAVLLRLCEKLASTGGAKSWEGPKSIVHSDIMDLILNYQRPMPGVVNCSIPFLSGDGDRLHVSLPPYGCLPPLPHGASVTSVCRLLGAEGLTALLAAVLTECKILVHSADVANLAMVGEVITALMCPFTWQLPCIPVLPLSMITFVEAPVSYFIGVPSCNMKFVDKDALIDVVVIDLDNGFSSPDYFNGRRNHDSSLSTPLPASVSSNISKAIFKLLREEEEVHEQYGTSAFSGSRHLSRLEGESLAERDFRIAVAHQVCGLIRGYQECLFFVSACQPVFNRDRFLRQAPALFEERRGMSPSTSSSSVPSTTSASFKKIISPRSKRFLSGLVNSQHFHALLEMLDHESNAFFHDIMDTFQDEADDGSAACSYGSAKQRSVIATLRASLDASEQVVPTYHAHNQRLDDLEEESEDFDFIGGYFSSFTTNLLQPVKKVSTPAVTPSEDTPGDSTILSTAPKTSKSSIEVDEDDKSIRKMSLKDLVELDKIPWVYKKIFDIDMKPSSMSEKSKLWKKIHLKEALGENKFNEWKAEQESKDIDDELEDDVGDGISSGMKRPLKSSLDLTKLISNIRSDEVPNRNFVSKLERGIASDRAVIKRYIEKAYEIVEELKEGLLEVDQVEEQFDDINAQVDAAMKNPSAQRFLMSVLSQRSRLQNENRRIDNRAALRPGYRIEVSTSNLHPLVFDCLHRLCSAMLEACHHEYDYEAAYKLLIHTTGFCTADENMMVCYMTKQIATHKIYGDLRLWDRVLLIHQQDRQRDKNVNESKATRAESAENDEYEATVSTLYEMLGYGMPADDLARFTYRVANEKFYSTDKEQKLLTLARRLAVKCDEAAPEEDIESDDGDQSCESKFENVTVDHGKDWQWEELNWTHPGSGGAYTDQAPITGLASFGGSIIATGALDGSVYLASTLHLDKEKRGKIGGQFVRGVQLLWPSTPPLASGSGGQQDIVSNGAISCLVAIQGSDHHKKKSSSINSDGAENDSEAFSIEGCRLVGGTTGGNLAVWDIPNAMEEVFAGELADGFDNLTSLISDVKIHNSGTQSSNVRGASSPAAYNKRSNKDKTGVSLGGHRGGVTCLAVPSQIYRPDSLISGGNDGLIKFWSLRTRPEARQSNRRQTMGGRTSRMLFSNNEKALGKDTLDVLAGHGGRILCVEVAWHGDRLLSGAADRTVKLWDLASQSGGRCLQTMHGHTSGVTHGRYWGRNTIVSASSDRSIALWDTRSGSSPLFVLRYHNGPISDLYLESRTSFWMTSAGNDGTIGTWDFRMMKTMNGDMDSGKPVIRAQTIRYPLAQMCHANQSSGPVHLGRGVGTKFGQGERSVMSVGVDNIIKQWDALNGDLLDEHRISSRSKVSCFKSFAAGENLIRGQTDRDGVIASLKLGGTITTSWDGTVRLRRLCLG